MPKLCIKCNKPGEFYQKGNVCKACNKQYHKERSEVIRLLKWNYLADNPCVDCGEIDPRVLTFDHVRGTKAHNVSNLRVSPRKFWEEVAKCVVRCSNCHHKRTFKQFNWFVGHIPFKWLDKK